MLPDGIILMVTGSIKLQGQRLRQFAQTFFLALQLQKNGRHNYVVMNDIFRLLDTIPDVLKVGHADNERFSMHVIEVCNTLCRHERHLPPAGHQTRCAQGGPCRQVLYIYMRIFRCMYM
eukprot:TRINITY_DN9207_c0_g1_i2.p3 TRINITY_DN9207_c0_g1~~TRINITY_DN9207_c0_g1_i2.p3  ORF type:complete len:119 (-),score=26.86 TRINITY_DN9207_c0_g1_i2:744-1100(-)